MKYSVGDKVKVRSDLRVGEAYNGCMFASGMLKFIGKTCTISKTYINEYHLLEDCNLCQYAWTDEMFEGLDEEVETKKQVDEILYINAEEARNIFNKYHSIIGLRETIYKGIRERCHLCKNEEVNVSGYESEIVELMIKELIFKGFKAELTYSYIGSKNIYISW